MCKWKVFCNDFQTSVLNAPWIETINAQKICIKNCFCTLFDLMIGTLRYYILFIKKKLECEEAHYLRTIIIWKLIVRMCII